MIFLNNSLVLFFVLCQRKRWVAVWLSNCIRVALYLHSFFCRLRNRLFDRVERRSPQEAYKVSKAAVQAHEALKHLIIRSVALQYEFYLSLFLNFQYQNNT